MSYRASEAETLLPSDYLLDSLLAWCWHVHFAPCTGVLDSETRSRHSPRPGAGSGASVRVSSRAKLQVNRSTRSEDLHVPPDQFAIGGSLEL